MGEAAFVVEFRHHAPSSSWLPVALRGDKVHPNHLTVAWNSLELAVERLTLQQMMRDIEGPSRRPRSEPSRKRSRADQTRTSVEEKEDEVSSLASSPVPSSEEEREPE
jgi:hypothetical protein